MWPWQYKDIADLGTRKKILLLFAITIHIKYMFSEKKIDFEGININ
jgi:hypothetical protein